MAKQVNRKNRLAKIRVAKTNITEALCHFNLQDITDDERKLIGNAFGSMYYLVGVARKAKT